MPGLLLQYEKWLFYAQAGALVAALIRIASSRLQRVYPYFFSYLLVQTIQLAIPFLIPRMTDLYVHAFLATEAVIVCLYALIILELYSLVFKNLHGIATLAGRYIKVAIGLAVAVSVTILAFERLPGNLLTHFYIFERTIDASLVFFLLLITVLLVYYPIPLSRNILSYSIGYAVYFISKASALFLRNTGHEWDLAFSVAMLAVSTACLLFWAIFLNADGEKRTGVSGHKWNPGDDERLLRQLEAINAGLSHSRK